MAKCNKCNCDCHCKDGGLHTHHYDGDLCTCDTCECREDKSKADDLSYENNGGVIIDDTDECESCQ
jgi:hypothetical protein